MPEGVASHGHPRLCALEALQSTGVFLHAWPLSPGRGATPQGSGSWQGRTGAGAGAMAAMQGPCGCWVNSGETWPLALPRRLRGTFSSSLLAPHPQQTPPPPGLREFPEGPPGCGWARVCLGRTPSHRTLSLGGLPLGVTESQD